MKTNRTRPWLTSQNRTLGTTTWFGDLMTEKGITPEKLLEKIENQAKSYAKCYDNVHFRGVVNKCGGLTIHICGDLKPIQERQNPDGTWK